MLPAYQSVGLFRLAANAFIVAAEKQRIAGPALCLFGVSELSDSLVAEEDSSEADSESSSADSTFIQLGSLVLIERHRFARHPGSASSLSEESSELTSLLFFAGL